ncbi:MAG: DUF2441 domain-containing protein, partial [Alphaproteobacteria bacterium]|nr:DUF2441 domain-containing protein [Alphaproteobacteria bacterium]
MDRYQSYLINEYSRAGIPNICRCKLGGTDVIVPVDYRGNINKFKSDLFDTDRLKNASRDKIIKGALRRYKSTIQKAIRIKNEYKHGSFYIRMSTDFIRKLDTLHQKHLLKRLTDDMQSILKWTTKQTLSVTIGSLGALPAATYWLLDKKVHFTDNTKHKFIKEKLLPYIRRGALKAMILTSLATGADFSIKQMTKDKDGDNMEYVVSSQKKYKITNKEDFDKMYRDVFPLTVKSMLPTEILVCKPYSDNGKKVIQDYVYNQSRAVRETVTELVRVSFFPEKPSRLTCLYVCRTLEDAYKWKENFEGYSRKVLQLVELSSDG